MKPPSVLIDASCFPEGPQRTSTLTAELHAPELLPDGWLRFKIDGPKDDTGKPKHVEWYLLPPHAVKRVNERTEYPKPDTNIGKSIEVPYLVSKRKPKPV